MTNEKLSKNQVQNMGIFEILNVGQGDSIILRPPAECKFTDETYIVDLGVGKYNITQHIQSDEKIHIILTHHDNDHIGGMRFFIGRMDQIVEIIVPFYQNEITLIARAILSLKGINSSKDCNEFIKELEAIVNNQVNIKTILDDRMRLRLSFAYEGRHFCNHIECLNPPVMIGTNDWMGETDIDDLNQHMHELFTGSFAREMEQYIRANDNESNRMRNVDSEKFDSYWIYNGRDESSEASRAKCNYVLEFIMRNATLFKKFNDKGSRETMRKIYSRYVKCTHDVCVVLKTSYKNETMLLTGDASKKVFRRLLNEGKDISASYLKMPHHGSKHNINEKILNAINPRVAIISHENGHFGKAKDTHPNQEVLELLMQKNIKILITNDVIKGDITVMKKANHSKDNYVMIS